LTQYQEFEGTAMRLKSKAAIDLKEERKPFIASRADA
jgi:hypothetical protein